MVESFMRYALMMMKGLSDGKPENSVPNGSLTLNDTQGFDVPIANAHLRKPRSPFIGAVRLMFISDGIHDEKGLKPLKIWPAVAFLFLIFNFDCLTTGYLP